MNGLKRWVATAAVLGLVAATLFIIVGTSQRAGMLVDTGETRASVESSLKRLLPATVQSATDATLISAAERLKNERYIASVWIADYSGRIVFHWRGPGSEGQNVRGLAQADITGALEALAPGTLSRFQKLQLLAVSAIRREGEHNDVFRHMVRPVAGKGGSPAALVVLAYDVNPRVSDPPGQTEILSLFSVAAGLMLYWLGLPLWVYLDAKSRGDVAALWAIFVLFTNLVGLLAYLIAVARPKGGVR